MFTNRASYAVHVPKKVMQRSYGFFPTRHHDWYVHIFPSCLKWHLHQRSSTMTLQRESHLTKQAPQTIRSYLFGLARDHLALAITTNVVAWLVGLFLGEKTPKVLSSQHQKKQRRNRIEETWDPTGFNFLKKQFLGPMLVFTKSILDCPFLRGFPSLSKPAFVHIFFLGLHGLAWTQGGWS